MKTIEIDLTFRRADFEELYFRNGNENLFFSPTAKTQTHIFIFLGLLFLFFLVHFRITNESQENMLFVCILWILSAIILGGKIYTVLKWRKSIKTFLDKTSKYKINKLIVSEVSISIIQDDKEHIEKWSEFKKADINDELIILCSTVNYMFPKKSMTNQEYELIKEIVRDRILNTV
ncbi:hypothetical protein [Flavobacterium soli]|uniref:hypothetical protein n=1 Tax=Flavobacterium soli TaxID=344881 RepID=UPI0004222B1C|nr:hypothetical protein [Flavobacterium soli]